MGGGFQVWGWPRERSGSVCKNKKRGDIEKKWRVTGNAQKRVQFKEDSDVSVVLNQNKKKRIWITRLWLSLKKSRKQKASETTMEPSCKLELFIMSYSCITQWYIA